MMRRLLAAGAAALMLAAGLSLSTASAAQLQVFTGLQTSLNDASACAPAMSAGRPVIQATASGTPSGGQYSQIQLSAVPAACQGLERQVFVHDASGAPIASGTAAAGVTAVDVGQYSPSDVVTVVTKFGGWVFPTTWIAPDVPPVGGVIPCRAVNNGGGTTGQPCTVTITNVSHWIQYPGSWGVGTPYEHVYLSFEVNTGQNRWEVTFDFTDTETFPGSGFTPTYVGDGYNVVKAPGYTCSSLPTFVAWKGAGNVASQNNGNLYWTNQPNSTNGTTRLCP